MAKYRIDDVVDLIVEGCEKRGLPKEDAQFVARDLVGADLAGKPSQGLVKLDGHLAEALENRSGRSPRVVSDEGALIRMDGEREIGWAALRRGAIEAVKRAEKLGAAVVVVTNYSYAGRVGSYSGLIAASGLVGQVQTSAGPPLIAFPGGQPSFGVSTVAISTPDGNGGAFTHDGTTSAGSWYLTSLAQAAGTPLPENVFLDTNGAFTRDPSAAAAVAPDGIRSAGLGISIERAGGALAGAPMGAAVPDEYGCVAVITAMKPVERPAEYAERSYAFSDEIRAASPSARVPGERSAQLEAQGWASGEIEIKPELFQKIQEFASVGREIGAHVEHGR